MLKTENQPFAHAMAFFHQDGLPAAWKQAMKFAGKDGRLATMPDIIATRLESKPGDPAWEMYYTTLTAEYLGLSKAGRKILIVAHGIGPMSTMDGAIKAYRYEFKDPERRHNGGRISQEEFWELESGKFGEVNIIDFDKYCKRYQYPFISHLRLSEAIDDEVVKARFGPQALHYLQAHAEHARAWHLAPHEAKRIQVVSELEKLWPGFSKYVMDSSTYTYHPSSVAFWPIGRSQIDEMSQALRTPNKGLFLVGDYLYGSHSHAAAQSAMDAVPKIMKFLSNNNLPAK